MKPYFKGLRTTIYKVDNIEKGKKWYAEAFGIEPYFDEPFYVGFNIGGFELGLQSGGIDSLSKQPNVVSYWGVDNIKEAYERLLNLGATEHEEPKNVGGELMVATVKDPWNNAIGIIYNPYFKIEAE